MYLPSCTHRAGTDTCSTVKASESETERDRERENRHWVDLTWLTYGIFAAGRKLFRKCW